MTVSVQSLTWTPQEDATQPLAIYTVDFSIDNVWQFKTSDSGYQNKRVNPAGVMVDNSNNRFAVNIVFGPLTVPVAPLSRQPVSLPAGVDFVTVTAPSVPGAGTVGVIFYLVPPAAGAAGVGSIPAPANQNVTILGQPLAVNATLVGASINDEPEGASFFTVITGLAAGVTQIQAPATNVNGMIIRRALLGGNTLASIYVDNGAPANNTDGTRRAILNVNTSNAILPNPMKFPAGFGIWVATGAAVTCALSWDNL